MDMDVDTSEVDLGDFSDLSDFSDFGDMNDTQEETSEVKNEETTEEIKNEIKNENNKETVRVIMVSFGSLFTRRLQQRDEEGTTEQEMEHMQYTLEIFTQYMGKHTSAIFTDAKVHKTQKEWTPNNARVRIQYETLNRDTVWPELHNKVAVKRRTPAPSFTLFSVFGNVIYCPFAREIECTAIRNLSHVAVLSKITRDETLNRGPSSVLLMRYALSGHIGHNIQTSYNCMLEVMLVKLFRKTVHIVPRTEEDASTVYFRIPSMKLFNETLDCIEKSQRSTMAASVIAEHMEHCTAYVQVTYLGTMFVRYVWDTNHPVFALSDIEDVKTFFMETTKTLANVINMIS